MKYLKRYIILLFLILFVIPLAYAEMNIDLPEKDLYNLGVRIFMAKPVKINRLVKEIDELIEESEEDEINKND